MPHLRRILALVAGVLLLAVGVGVGVPHLRRTGFSPLTVVGLVALVAGLALVGVASVRLVRSVPRWWRLAVVPALLVVVLLGLDLLVTPFAASIVARAPLGEMSADLAARGPLDVTVPTDDGESLAGWYVPSETGAAVVLLHGSGSTRTAVQAHAVELADRGYGVLCVDARGHGESTGRAMDWGWSGDADVEGAVTFLSAQPDVDPGRIAALGLSMGGEQAVGAAAADPRLRAVVAEGVTGRSATDLTWLSDVYGTRGRFQEGIELVQTSVADVLSPASPPTALRAAVAATSPRPVLLIVAGEVEDEAHAAEHIRAGAPGAVEVWEVPGAGHTGALATDPDAWRERVIEFLDAATD